MSINVLSWFLVFVHIYQTTLQQILNLVQGPNIDPNMVPHYPHGHCFEKHERTLGLPDNASMMPLFLPICCWRENYPKEKKQFLCKNYTLVGSRILHQGSWFGQTRISIIEDAAIHVTVFYRIFILNIPM